MSKTQTTYQVIDTWNGGKLGHVVKFIGNSAYECEKWIHNNTPFSVHEATLNQGYTIIEVNGDLK